MSGYAGAVDLTRGPELRAILRFTGPLFVGNFFQQLYNVVDTLIVGKHVGYEAMAAVGLCFPVIFTSLALFMGIGAGVNVVVARRTGAGDQAGVERAVRAAWLLVLAGCVPVTLFGTLWAEPVLRLLQVPEHILPDAAGYMRIYFAASFANLGYGINDGILRGVGDSGATLRFLLISCLTNVALDLFFVLALDWAVAGVAAATAAAQVLAWALSAVYIRRRCLGRGGRGPLRPSLGEICRIGLPAGLQHMIFSFGTIVIQVVINGCGDSFIAGFNAASKIDMFAFMPIQSFSSAATSFVGQNLGAGKSERVRTGVASALKLSLAVDAVVVSAVLCLGPWLLGLFNSEAAVIQAGLAYLYRILPFYLIYTVTSMAQSVFRGMGDVAVPTVIMIAALWLGRVPASWLLTARFGQENLFFCYGIGWTIELALLALYYRSGRWRRRL